MAKRPIRLATSRKEPRPTQRELDQEATLSTFRLLFATMIRKYGECDTITLTRKEIQAMESADLRVVDDQRGNIHLAIKIGNLPPRMGPRLIVPR